MNDRNSVPSILPLCLSFRPRTTNDNDDDDDYAEDDYDDDDQMKHVIVRSLLVVKSQGNISTL